MATDTETKTEKLKISFNTQMDRCVDKDTQLLGVTSGGYGCPGMSLASLYRVDDYLARDGNIKGDHQITLFKITAMATVENPEE